MRHDIGVLEAQRDTFARLGAQFFLGVLQGVAGLELHLPHGTSAHLNLPLYGIGLTARDQCSVLVRLILRHGDITGEIREGLTKMMCGQEDILGTIGGDTDM